jgi:hypothetical protein
MERPDSAQHGDPARPRSFPVGAVAATVFLLGLGVVLWRASGDNPGAEAAEENRDKRRTAPKTVADIFPKWPKPDLALLLSAQQHGYLQPCGCSSPQFGGLTRRYNFLQLLQLAGWPVVAADLGDIPPRSGLQAMLKYTTSMKALDRMGYAAVTIGEYEILMPLWEALGNYALNYPSPRVLAANLSNKEREYPEQVDSWKVVESKGRLKVGIIASVGPSVVQKVKNAKVGFDAGPKVLPKMVREIGAKKPDFLVLLYQGSVREAKACAKAIPNFHVILCLSEAEEPPGMPDQVGNTMIINVGHKGRYVGVVGAYRTGKAQKAYELHYQLVALGEEFDTPAGKEKGHPLMTLMEGYAREVKKEGYLATASKRRIPHEIQLAFPSATYVGSGMCKKCHEGVYEIWEKSPHSRAYTTLAKAINPSQRQYDPDCISCHVTGWGYKGGFANEVKTKLLVNNGCENCHGPGSEHILAESGQLKVPDLPKVRKQIRDLMNPNRFDPEETAETRTKRHNRIDLSCQNCHDSDNDVHWKIDKWWDGKIVHSDDPKNVKKKGN